MREVRELGERVLVLVPRAWGSERRTDGRRLNLVWSAGVCARVLAVCVCVCVCVCVGCTLCLSVGWGAVLALAACDLRGVPAAARTAQQ